MEQFTNTNHDTESSMECLQCKNEIKNYGKKFCNNSCSAIYNNQLRTKRELTNCQNCGTKTNKIYCSTKCYNKVRSKQKIENFAAIIKSGIYHCPNCNTTKPLSEFYVLKNKVHSYCRECKNIDLKHRQAAFKQLCVDYKGGKCEKCGYNKCIAALDFHHKDHTKKDFAISSRPIISLKSIDKIKPELDKCILLCSNCHRETHYNK